MSETHPVIIAFGTNLGDRLENLRAALRALPPAVHMQALSPVYETPPWGLAEQPAFLNMVGQGVTALAPLDLLRFLKDLETQLGRQPGVRYGPRLIDLDILFYDDWVVNEVDLTIPHPRIPERAFVLIPLAALAPELQHPLLEETMAQLAARVNGEGIVQVQGPLEVER
jgi:2-amino-4-hydroxy-6-hydroxymethyldihydropteridine diphosphokinase